VAAVLLLLAAGWFLARLARAAVTRGARAIGVGREGIWGRLFVAMGELLHWAILIAFVVAAIQITRSVETGNWIDWLGEFLPHLLGAVAVLVAGMLLSLLVRDLAVRYLSHFGVEQARTAARTLQTIVLVTAFVVAIDQVGIEIGFLVTMIAILAGGVVFALSLSFALGAADLVRNLVAARDARRYYSPGQRVRVGDLEGELLEITPTVIVLGTQNGRVTVPARVFHESSITLLEVTHDG
jgi:hypothetical protein